MRPNNEPLSLSARLWLAVYSTWVALGIVLVSTCSSCAGRQIPDDVPTMTDVAVAQLVLIEQGKEAGFCTAFKVGPERIMTAGHCCEPDAQYITRGPHGVPGNMPTVLYDDDEHDVCVLKGRIAGQAFALANQDPPIGARVWTAGWPKGHFLISDGYWSGRHYDGGDGAGERSVASTVVCGGASGSAVLDSRSQVVGVIIELVPGSDNITRIAPLEWLRAAATIAK